MSEESKPIQQASNAFDRRQLLRVVGTSAGALLFAKVLTGCQPNPTGSPPSGPVGAMKVADLKLDSLHVLSSNVVIGLDSNGVYAMSAICTHAGCVLDD